MTPLASLMPAQGADASCSPGSLLARGLMVDETAGQPGRGNPSIELGHPLPQRTDMTPVHVTDIPSASIGTRPWRQPTSHRFNPLVPHSNRRMKP